MQLVWCCVESIPGADLNLGHVDRRGTRGKPNLPVTTILRLMWLTIMLSLSSIFELHWFGVLWHCSSVYGWSWSVPVASSYLVSLQAGGPAAQPNYPWKLDKKGAAVRPSSTVDLSSMSRYPYAAVACSTLVVPSCGLQQMRSWALFPCSCCLCQRLVCLMEVQANAGCKRVSSACIHRRSLLDLATLWCWRRACRRGSREFNAHHCPGHPSVATIASCLFGPVHPATHVILQVPVTLECRAFL
jgi:hypothetical protein